MKKKIALACFIIVSISLFSVAYMHFNSAYMYRYIFYCHLEESNDKYIFKATPTTFDTTIFGTSVYIKANREVTKQIDELCKNKAIDLNEEIILTFDCHRIKDITKGASTTYFQIDKLISIKQV